MPELSGFVSLTNISDILISVSRYLLIILMAVYTVQCFTVFRYKSAKRQKVIFLRQNISMFIIHFLAFLILFTEQTNLQIVVFYAVQAVFLLLCLILWYTLYPRASRLLINNMMMLITIGMIMLTRLSFDSAEKPYLERIARAFGGVSTHACGKIANGIDDTPVTSMAAVVMGTDIPIAIAPAMHQSMYDNPIVTDNIDKLKSLGVEFIGPRFEDGRAKVASAEEIVANVKRILSDSPLAGKKVLVIGGRSEEPIDDMRLISNRSSGRFAVDLAEAAFERDAETELWMGACSVQLPGYIKTRRFETVEDLAEMVENIDHDIVIVPAALGDFRVKDVRDGKITSDSELRLQLEPAPKILQMITSRCKMVLGFKAESGLTEEQLIERARSRLNEYGLYAVVANDIDSAGKEEISVIMVREDFEDVITGSKKKIAGEILDQYFGGE